MDKYILDGQYGKYLEMLGVHVGEALKKAGVPEDLFSHRNPVLDERDYYCFMEAVASQVTDPQLPVTIASSDNIESFSPPIFAAYCSKNPRECMERLSRYKRIIAPMRYEITDCENTVMIEIAASREELHMPQFLIETEMIFLVHMLARHYITKTDMSNDDIAFLLGYQELNSFLRAFSVWTGMSVGEYKRKFKV